MVVSSTFAASDGDGYELQMGRWSRRLHSLAREVATSRTALAVRFKELVGEAPMAYLTRWHITRAANRMRSERINLSRLAESVGYNSDAVFSKAFRRVTGQSPGRIATMAPLAASKSRNRAPAGDVRRLIARRPAGNSVAIHFFSAALAT